MADISSITLPNGSTYNLKDATKVPVYGMGKNLLDNWYFKSPVNQRGLTTYTFSSGDYSIDRWKLYRGTITITASGLSYQWDGTSGYSPFHQKINNYDACIGETVTMSVLLGDGNLYSDTFTVPSSGSYSSEQFDQIRFFANASSKSVEIGKVLATSAIVLVAAKLELGSQQTLAHLEGSTWVLNEIPDYEEELIKCQTSTADSTDTYANNSLATEQQLAYKAPAGFGLGVQLNTLTAILDANLITATGWYSTVTGTANLPSDRDTSYAGVIEAVVRGTTFMYQKYYDYHSGKIFERIKNSDSWNSWRLIAPTATEQEIAYVESGSTASRAYAVGEYFTLGGTLCRTKTTIAQGATFTLNTNYEEVPGGISNQNFAKYAGTAITGCSITKQTDSRVIISLFTGAGSTNAAGTMQLDFNGTTARFRIYDGTNWTNIKTW